MSALGGENRLAGIIDQRKHKQVHVVMLAQHDGSAERRKALAIAVFDEDFAAKVQIRNGADMSVDADQKGLGAVLPLGEIGLELDAFNEFGGGISGIQKDVG